MPDLTGQVAIVTGANSGIGLETARELARKGALVVMAVRDAGRGDAAAEDVRRSVSDARVEVSRLDLADLSSVADFVAAFGRDHDKLDLLINNAGVMVCPYGRTRDGFEQQIGVNHLGHFALTASLVDKLAAAPSARVVTVSSLAHRRGRIVPDDLHWERRSYHRWKAYQQSKLANLLFTRELQRRLEAGGSTTLAVACHPGWTNTNLVQYMPRVAGFAGAVLAQSPQQGALPTLYAAAVADVRAGDYIGPDGRLEWTGYPTRVGTRPQARDDRMARTLWDLSEDLTGASLT